MDTPDRLIRAARHYERAVHILIRQTVKSVQNHMVSSSDQVNNSTRPPIGILKNLYFPYQRFQYSSLITKFNL